MSRGQPAYSRQEPNTKCFSNTSNALLNFCTALQQQARHALACSNILHTGCKITRNRIPHTGRQTVNSQSTFNVLLYRLSISNNPSVTKR